MLDDSDLEGIFSLLEREIGLEARSLGRGALARLMAKHMAELGFSCSREYHAELRELGEGYTGLVEQLVVTESWFFREAQAIQHFIGRARDTQGPLRVLCAPCARGEEAYTLAIALLEAGVANFRIVGLDISEEAIRFARKGIYSSHSFRGRKAASMAKYLRPKGPVHEVRAEVKEKVSFDVRNILSNLGPHTYPYHAIFCRNLLIYLSASARHTLLQTLRANLSPGACLYVGVNESPSIPRDLFDSVEPCFAFSSRPMGIPKGGTGRKLPKKSPPRKADTVMRPSPKPKLRVPAAPPTEEQSECPAEDLNLARQLADQGRLDEAAEVCEKLLERESSSVGYHLMAAINSAQDKHEMARENLRRSLYLDRKNSQALLHSAVYAELDGRLDIAEGFRRRARLAETEEGAQ